MSDRNAHNEKYRRLNRDHGLVWTDRDTADLPGGDWTKDKLKAKMAEHPDNHYLNFIPLAWWDRRTGLLFRVRGSLAEKVCMLKTACRDYVEGGK